MDLIRQTFVLSFTVFQVPSKKRARRLGIGNLGRGGRAVPHLMSANVSSLKHHNQVRQLSLALGGTVISF
jgi:hypothetical protein